jgi:hypothetical protein
VKLNEKKIRWIIAQKLQGESTLTIAEIRGISARRVQQIYKEYIEPTFRSIFLKITIFSDSVFETS